MEAPVAGQAKVWTQLAEGKPLDGLGLATVDGRLDLRGLTAPAPAFGREYGTRVATVRESSALPVVRGVHWKAIDFSACRLGSVRFYDSHIENCRFDAGHCQDWRMWNTTISNTTFRATDLRRSALGSIDEGRWNVFKKVDFSGADLRQTVYVSAEMIECTFEDANLTKTDFQGTLFERCVFAGELKDVLFSRHAYGGEALQPNEMKHVDFGRARLRHVEFRRLDMKDVKWPEDEQHVVLDDYPRSLDRMLSMLNARSDVPSKQLAAILSLNRKWAGANQKRGILNKLDLYEYADERAVAELLALRVGP